MPYFDTVPTTVEAERYDGTYESFAKLAKWSNGAVHQGVRNPLCDTLEGTSYEVPANYWIIKGIKGEFYPCDPEVFARKYKPSSAR